MKMNKNTGAYKTIGEVVKILGLKTKKVARKQLTQSVIGKKNLNKLSLRYWMEIEDIMTKKILKY